MVCLSMKSSLFEILLKSRTHIALHQAEPVPRPDTLLKIAPRFSYAVESPGSWVTVGELRSDEIFVLRMPSVKAKKLAKSAEETIVLEYGNRFANSIEIRAKFPHRDICPAK